VDESSIVNNAPQSPKHFHGNAAFLLISVAQSTGKGAANIGLQKRRSSNLAAETPYIHSLDQQLGSAALTVFLILLVLSRILPVRVNVPLLLLTRLPSLAELSRLAALLTLTRLALVLLTAVLV
jgi:hypothetical protein